jgi:hypothetical protein
MRFLERVTITDPLCHGLWQAVCQQDRLRRAIAGCRDQFERAAAIGLLAARAAWRSVLVSPHD